MSEGPVLRSPRDQGLGSFVVSRQLLGWEGPLEFRDPPIEASSFGHPKIQSTGSAFQVSSLGLVLRAKRSCCRWGWLWDLAGGCQRDVASIFPLRGAARLTKGTCKVHSYSCF